MESIPKRARRQPDDHYGQVKRALSLYSPGLGAHFGRYLWGSRACWTLRGFVSGHSPAANGPHVLVIRPSVGLAPLVSPSFRRNWSSMGGFAGLLEVAVSSDSPVGCSRTAKASEIERSPGSGFTQALMYRL